MPYLLCFARLLYELSPALSSIIFFTIYKYFLLHEYPLASGEELFTNSLWMNNFESLRSIFLT